MTHNLRDGALLIPSGRRGLGSFTVLVLLALAGAAGTAAAVAALLGYAGRAWWMFDLLSHFRVQYFVVLAVVAICFAVARWRRLAVMFALVAVVDLWPMLPYMPSGWSGYGAKGMPFTLGGPTGVRPQADGSGTLRLATVNVHVANRSYDAVIRFVEDYEPDLVLMVETNGSWIEALEQLPPEYRLEAADPRGDAFGIAMYSMIPDTSCEVVHVGAVGVPSVSCHVALKGRPVTILGTHPVPPVSGSNAALRNEQLAAITHRLASTAGPEIVLGDLNVSPWSPHFADLIRSTGLRDAALGTGATPTWNTRSRLVRTPIDHVLISDDFIALSRVVGPDVGSDHFPVVAEVTLDAK
jgi:endonuclease/exonuclease/phosphatase (EEP) superfamily protein YafD